MNLDNFMSRLVKAIIFGVCLLSVVRFPTAMSAPASTYCQDSEYTDGNVPKWINPCGQEFVVDNSSGGSSSGENDTDIISQVLMAAKIALEYMENFRENYVNETFQTTYHLQLEISKEHKFLPNHHDARVPKKIGEKVEQSHLETLTLDEFLQEMYRYIQLYAVGIELVIVDQQNYGGKFRREFTDTESHLRKVLCELRMGMSNKNIKPQNKVGRCVMDTLRNIDVTGQRNLRDWIIFRECMNGLEYLIQVMEYLGDKSSS